VENTVKGSFSPLTKLKFHKRAWRAGAQALAVRHNSNWGITDPPEPTMAQETKARAVVDAALRELQVTDLFFAAKDVVDSRVGVRGVSGEALDRLDALLSEMILHNEGV
jgi:hypothetical protein